MRNFKIFVGFKGEDMKSAAYISTTQPQNAAGLPKLKSYPHNLKMKTTFKAGNEKEEIMTGRKGFTLVELLVVISIIALLLSVLMPALSKARQQAQSIVCRSNSKQLGLAALLWAEDNKGWTIASSWFYPTTMWGKPNPSSLDPYTATSTKDSTNTDNVRKGSVYACPSAKKMKFATDAYWLSTDRNLRWTYGANSWIVIDTAWQGYPGDKPESNGKDWTGPIDPIRKEGIYGFLHGNTKLANIRQQANTVYFTDFDYNLIGDGMYNPLKKRRELYLHAARWHEIKSGQEYGYGNIIWADGHASKEPSDFANKRKPGQLVCDERWRYYFYKH
jgi:prepilin-type N-terminal cleavage/methylation domain-containing protein/prepilin-type processing-associated H-X9-DG protein